MEPFQLHASSEEPPLFMLKSWCELDGITAGFTTRQAGNTALHVGDSPQSVINNRRGVTDRLGWSFEAFTCAEQVHGNEVHVISPGDKGRGRSERSSAISDSDALITNESNVLMAMYFADCVPLYFYDPVTGSMGLAHAGWKGTVAEIAVKTVEKMQTQFGVQPSNLLAAIGPSIGSCCYEVDQNVLKHVVPLMESLHADNPSIGASDIIKPVAEKGRAMLDLKHLNRHLMIKAGILPSRIEMSSWCTGCRTDLLFSHRMEKGATGRMMSWLGRKSR